MRLSLFGLTLRIESDSVGLRQNSLIPFLFSNAQTVNVESDEAAPLSQKPWLEEVDWPITQRQSAAPRSKILARLMATAIRPDREAQNLGLVCNAVSQHRERV